MPNVAPSAEVLRYAAAPRRVKRLRVLVAAGCAALLVCAGLQWAPGIAARAALLHWQRQCMGYELGDGTLPGTVAPQCWRRFGELTGTWQLPPAVEGTHVSLWPYRVTDHVAFLHERTTPMGRRRLVAVKAYASVGGEPDEFDPEFDGNNPGAFLSVSFRYDVRRPVPVVGPLPLSGGSRFQELDLGRGSSVSLFCGQPDPRDGSRSTYRFEVDGKPGTIDARLQDDDTIKFEVRDGAGDDCKRDGDGKRDGSN